MNGQLPLHQNLKTTIPSRINNLSKLLHTLQGMQSLYTCTCPDSPFNVTMCKHIDLVIKYINSHLNRIPVEPSNVPMKGMRKYSMK